MLSNVPPAERRLFAAGVAGSTDGDGGKVGPARGKEPDAKFGALLVEHLPEDQRMKPYLTITALSLVALAALATGASAQFTGPGSGQGYGVRNGTAAQARGARLGTSLTLTGRIVARERENYYSFRDASGTIRVEIEDALWQNRPVGPNDRMRLVAEVDQGPRGRYLWVKSITLVE